MIIGDYIEDFRYYKYSRRVLIVIQEIDKINRIYKTDRENDEVIFDVYDMILEKLDNESLVNKS